MECFFNFRFCVSKNMRAPVLHWMYDISFNIDLGVMNHRTNFFYSELVSEPQSPEPVIQRRCRMVSRRKKNRLKSIDLTKKFIFHHEKIISQVQPIVIWFLIALTTSFHVKNQTLSYTKNHMKNNKNPSLWKTL